MNLGIGLPTRVAGYLKPEQDIVLHSENGVLGFTALTDPDQADDDLINAGKELVSMLDGGSFMNSADSFDIMRGGHLDFCIMGAFQVAVNGDLANWHTGALDAVPAVGGRWIWRLVLAVSMSAWNMSLKWRTTNCGRTDLSDYRQNCVDRIYTDLCIIELKDNQAWVLEMVDGLSFEELQQQTGCKLLDGRAAAQLKASV